ncbi:hypothetical protein OHR68_39890 [Spirillospora sp. NBC_00431]
MTLNETSVILHQMIAARETGRRPANTHRPVTLGDRVMPERAL